MDILTSFRETFNELLLERDITVKRLSEDIGKSPIVVLRWKNQNKDLKLKSLITLADYFNCSLEFLCGKTDVALDYVPKPCPAFAEWLPTVLVSCNKTSYQLFKHTGIKASQFHYWKTGTEPLLSSLEILSEYLTVTLDYLVGRDRYI